MTLTAGEYHAFEAAGRQFVYLPGSGGIFELNDLAGAVLETASHAQLSREGLTGAAVSRGFDSMQVQEAVDELYQVRALRDERGWLDPPQSPAEQFPIETLVMNLTNQCNLSCGYCYEYGNDKVATPAGKAKFMDWETAQASVDYLFNECGPRRAVHITFFGGETLMNFPLLKRVVEYASTSAREAGRYIDFSLTTNGTLLTDEIIDFLAEHHIGVTVSMDGPAEMQNALRVYSNGRGSYDVVAPRVRKLIARHKSRPIAARVTLTASVTGVVQIFRHLRDELGFHEVGFAPVTSSPQQLYAISNAGMHDVFAEFQLLADEYLEKALRGEHHGFSNVSDTLAELHQGISKSHPCGAGLGLLGVGPSGDLAPCHRFVDSDTHALGNIHTGLDQSKRSEFLTRGHIDRKIECHTCWARPLCAGGCHHEAYVRYGDTGHPNLHYCEWIRGWTALCLRIYGAISVVNPSFLDHFERRTTA